MDRRRGLPGRRRRCRRSRPSGTSALAAINARYPSACGGQYTQVFLPNSIVDEEMILTRYPVLDSATARAARNPGLLQRHVLHARVDHPSGPIDVFTTHLASELRQRRRRLRGAVPRRVRERGRGDEPPVSGGAARELGRAAPHHAHARDRDRRHERPAWQLRVQPLRAHARLHRHYLAAGMPECNAATGVGCTSGREDSNLSELESPVSNEVVRIDFTFLVPPPPASSYILTIEGPGDLDGDGTTTRIFTDAPNPFAPSCGPLPDAICWPSDHEGSELDLSRAVPGNRTSHWVGSDSETPAPPPRGSRVESVALAARPVCSLNSSRVDSARVFGSWLVLVRVR